MGLARRLPGVRVALASCRPWLRVSTASRHRCSQSPQSYSQSEHEKREWEHGWRRVGTVERRVGCDYALFARVAWVLPLSHVQVSERSAVAGGGGGMPWSVFDVFAPHKSSPPPRPVQRPRTPAVQSRAPALPPDSGWLSGPVVLRLQEGADRAALKPVAQAAQKLKLATTAGEDWTVLWSYKPPWDLDSLARRRVAGARPYLVNHLPGTIRLVSKVHLAKFSAEVRPARRLGLGSLTAKILGSLAASLTEP